MGRKEMRSSVVFFRALQLGDKFFLPISCPMRSSPDQLVSDGFSFTIGKIAPAYRRYANHVSISKFGQLFLRFPSMPKWALRLTKGECLWALSARQNRLAAAVCDHFSPVFLL